MVVRAFTKNRPCNKIDIWNCFRNGRRFKAVSVTMARGIIGAHVPNHMIAAGRLERVEIRGTESYRLTPDGEAWLKKGTETYIRNQYKKGYKGVLEDVSYPMSAWRKKFPVVES